MSQSDKNSASWQKIADQRAVEVADLRLALQWCVEHDGECLADFPNKLRAARHALAAESCNHPQQTLATVSAARLTDERLREIAKKHAHDACRPINALDPVSMQEEFRCQEIIFYALKDAPSSAASASAPIEALQGLIHAVDGMADMDEADGPEFIAAEKTLNDAMATAQDIVRRAESAAKPIQRICPYCTSDNEAIRSTYYDQTCEGCVKRMGKP